MALLGRSGTLSSTQSRLSAASELKTREKLIVRSSWFVENTSMRVGTVREGVGTLRRKLANTPSPSLSHNRSFRVPSPPRYEDAAGGAGRGTAPTYNRQPTRPAPSQCSERRPPNATNAQRRTPRTPNAATPNTQHPIPCLYRRLDTLSIPEYNVIFSDVAKNLLREVCGPAPATTHEARSRYCP
jgi:hypothetical protein